ncbi:unnamed protein product [Orchesella dallaii]|uniref:C2H2-type domain-containing protein n=1 Tax=Orchesella dallaii TaxID=48710 RepID=A0ABP1R8Q4_9HEXA
MMDNPVCFLCLKTIKKSDITQPREIPGEGKTVSASVSVFSKFVKEYLGLENEIGGDLITVFKNINNFCEKCKVVMGSLCEMYLEHLGIRRSLAWKLGELRNLLESSKIGVSEKLESVIIHSLATQVDSSVANVKKLRSLLVEKCIQKGNTSLPLLDEIKKEVQIEVESLCGGDDPDLFLTHEVKEESISSSEDFEENDDEEMRVDPMNKMRKLEEDQFQFYDESEIVSDCDDIASDPETRPNAESSGSGSESSSSALSERWEEDRRPKRKPIRQNKRASTAKTPRARAKHSKVDASNHKKKALQEMDCSLELNGWNCSICKEPTVDEANLKKHVVCHQNKFIKKNFPCTFCWRSFESSPSVDTHVVDNHMTVACDGAYSCDSPGCTLAFFTLEQLNSHLETHLKPEKSLCMCETCGLGCFNLTHLKLHMLRHIQSIKLLSADENAPKRKGSRLLYPCSNCDQIFPNFFELHDHFSRIHCSDISATHYNCPNCGKSARFKRLHRCGLKPQPIKLVCTECSDQNKKEYKSWYRLQAHRRDFHTPIKCSRCGETVIGLIAKKEHEDGKNKTCVLLHHCSTCGKGYSSVRRLKIHMRMVHIDRRFKCSECDKAFKLKAQLRYHVTAVHSLARAHTCVHCGRSFSLRKCLQNHLIKDHQIETSAEKKHPCPTCKESFVRKVFLESHILKCDPVAAAAIMPTCEICGRPIMGGHNKALMDKHVITHMSAEERGYYWKQQGKKAVVHLCPTCGKEFKSKQAMERHSSVHVVNKTFLCEQCPKAFPAKRNLILHIKHVHLEATVAPCYICGCPVVNGKQRGMMEKHVVTHMSEQERADYYRVKGIERKRKVYKCSPCGKEFKSKQNLGRHSCVYANNKFQCEQCPKAFRVEFSFQQHVKNFHSKCKRD